MLNKTEDNIEEGIVGDLIMTPTDPNVDSSIEGETFIKAKKTYEYVFNGEEHQDGWFVDAKYPIFLGIDHENPRKVSLKWDQTYSGQFELKYGNCVKTIIVESLF